MAKKISSRNTKAQILEAFEQLYAEHNQLQSEYDRLRDAKEALDKRLAELEPVPGAVQEGPTPEGTMAEHAYTIGIVLDGLAKLRAGFGSAVSRLSARLTAEVTKLEDLRRRCETKTNELKDLYGLVITENTLDDLIQEYRSKSEAFKEATKQTREAFDKEATEVRAAWQKEQQEHARVVKEQRESLKKERRRDDAEYKYDLELTRGLAAEQYEQKKKKLDRELEELVQAKEKEWEEREKAIADREREYEELKAGAEALPRDLQAAVRRAEREGTEIAQQRAKVRYDLLAKEEEGDRRVAELKIESLEEAIKQQAQRIKGLSAQLETVVRQDQDLAIKAIEGASRETSFQSIREIALEQAKKPQKAQ